MKLRKYQEDIILQVKKEISQGAKSVIAVAPCGSGKSVMQAVIAKSAGEKKNRVLFLVHRKELCEQIEATFARVGVDFNYCQISMVQTVSRNLDKIESPSIIITDETHHSLANTYTKIYKHFPDAIRLGFTATPIRLDKKGLHTIYESLVENVSVKWLIENNFLAKYELYSAKLVDVTNLKVRCGEYEKETVNELMEKQAIYGETVENYVKLANGKRAIIYCASVEASKSTASEFVSNNFTAYHLDGTTPKAERKRVIQAFRDGDIQILCNVDLFGEGFDVPDCECVILLRPTMSLSLYIQQAMRSMRHKEGKTAIIIDHVANCYKHGLPDDERQWSLEDVKKTKKSKLQDKQELINVCSKCLTVFPKEKDVCPKCGLKITKTAREIRGIEKINIELQKINLQVIYANKPYNHYKSLKTFEQLKLFQQAKGYKIGWCMFKCKELDIEIPQNYKTMMKYKDNYSMTDDVMRKSI